MDGSLSSTMVWVNAKINNRSLVNQSGCWVKKMQGELMSKKSPAGISWPKFFIQTTQKMLMTFMCRPFGLKDLKAPWEWPGQTVRKKVQLSPFSVVHYGFQHICGVMFQSFTCTYTHILWYIHMYLYLFVYPCMQCTDKHTHTHTLILQCFALSQE